MRRRLLSLAVATMVVTNLFIGATPINSKTENIKSKMEKELKESISYYEDYTNESNDTNEEIRMIIELTEMDESIISKVEDITGNKVEKVFDTLVCGFSISGKVGDINKIKKLNKVVSVEKAMEIEEEMYSSVQTTEVQSVWNNYDFTGKGMVIAVLDSGMDLGMDEFETISSSNLKITKEDAESKIQKLGKGKYYNDKVPFVYDYVDRDNDVSTDVTNHGNHVAGIAAANGQEYKGEATVNEDSIKGVAPDAQVLVMKVFSNRDSQNFLDCCIEALEDAVELGADAVNMSFGRLSDTQNENSLWRKALNNAAEKGVIIVNSAGNDSISTKDLFSQDLGNEFGIKDTATLDYISENTITVGSVENEYDIPSPYLRFLSDKGTDISTKFINDIGTDYIGYYTSDLDVLKEESEFTYCNEGYSEDMNDISGKVVLVNDEADNKTEVYNNAVANGAKALIIVESYSQMMVYQINSEITIPVIYIGPNKGNEFISCIENGDNKFKLVDSNGLVDRRDGGEVNNFSSWGPTPTFELKPDVVAPGGDIYSTLGNGEHGAMSGTSMSSPIVTGASVLLKEGLLQKNINLSGIDFTNYVKTALMNTAKPVINSDNIPNSPRQQGAGVVQIEKAIKNNVTATNEDGQAYIRLLNIGNTATFKIKLKNYGSEDVTYYLNNEDLYTEVIEDKKVKEVKIDGAYISFNTNSICVKANSEAEVIGTVSIPNTLEENNYVEGYIELKNNNGVSLSMPVLGFYGDWEEESIIDAPCYEDSSLYKATGLGLYTGKYASYFYYYGSGSNTSGILPAGSVNKDNVAISPNDDGKYDVADVRTFSVRNAKEVAYEVLDNNKDVIKTLEKLSDVHKNVIGSFENYFYCPRWDGKVYNTKTGEEELVEDGQYYIRVKSKGYLENAKEQIVEMPLKVDTTGPEVNNISIQTLGDGNYRIQWMGQDELSEISNNEVVITLNDDEMKVVSDFEVNNGVYSANINTTIDEINSVTVGLVDEVGNTTVSRKLCNETSYEDLQLINLYDGMKINTKNYNIKASVGEGISKVTINDENVSINNSSVESNISLNEGVNVVYIKAYDDNGQVVYNRAYNLIVDTIAPVYEIIGNEDELGKFIHYGDEINLKLKVEDNSNVTCRAVNISNGEYDKREVIASSDEDNIITITMNSVNDTNRIQLDVYDELGNRCETKEIEVYRRTKESYENYIDVTFDVDDDFYLNKNYVYINKDDLNDDGTYSISGIVIQNPISIKMNGEALSINKDLTFEKKVKVEKGVNIYKFEAEGYEFGERTTVERVLTVYYDDEAPEVTYNNVNEDKDGYIHTSDEIFILSGVAKDNNDYTLTINGSKEFTTTFDTNGGEEGFRKEFTRAINLKEGENKILVEAEDINGNKYSKVFNVVYDNLERNVLVRYIDRDTKEEIASSTEIVGKIGEEYSTNAKIIDGYTLVWDSKNTKGVFRDGTIIVTYEYNKQKCLKINSFKTDKVSPQPVRSKIKLTVDATGEGTLQYKFLIRDNKGNWYKLRDFENSNTFTWSANVAGNKTLYVDVKDGFGNVIRKSIEYSIR